ncbi:hypothetical protein HYALB_00004876 [Hymenoscyphus albidus]|uniref:Uncharacterized protein n=1 Tax=Hymenoscyphus albidus TaxID=595503 RepID=A0A9N9QC06_9HELO|nr:hypothetical protein HYALB_00004876 [Hymenoscyphus albidus]
MSQPRTDPKARNNDEPQQNPLIPDEENGPSYGSINSSNSKFRPKRWSTWASIPDTETDEEEIRFRKIWDYAKPIFIVVFLGVLFAVFMAYETGHGPGYGEHPPEKKGN